MRRYVLREHITFMYVTHVLCVTLSVRIRSFSGPHFLAFGLNTENKKKEGGKKLCRMQQM